MAPKMTDFDILCSVRHAYETTWRQRVLIARLAVPAFVMTLFCMMCATLIETKNIPGREVLLFLPAFAAQGWLASFLVRLSLMGPHKALDRSSSALRARAAGTVIYILMSLAIGLMMDGVSSFLPKEANSDIPSLSPMTVSFFFIFLLMWFWALPLGWLFVPAALGISLKFYVRSTMGIASSICLLVVWIAGTLPPVLFIFAIADIVHYLALPAFHVIGYILLVAAGVVSLIVTTLAATKGIGDMMNKSNKDNQP